MKDNKRIIGFTCAYTPLAIINAAFMPYRILPTGDCPDQAGRILHDNLCPQVKKILDGCKCKFIDDITATGVLDFLGNLREHGRSAQTYNHYLKAGKSFTRWLVRDRRTPTDPLGPAQTELPMGAENG